MTIQAVVKRKRRSRKGRGFSREELKEVGLIFRQALRLGIPVDFRRSTKHKENVETLKTYARELKLATLRTEDEERKKEITTSQATIDLAEVKGIGPTISTKLMEAGIKNANELTASSPEKIAKAIGSSEKRASKLIEEAHILLKKKTK